MGCKGTIAANSIEMRAILRELFVRGQYVAAATHRLSQCLHASKCGRLCPRLVKAYGRPLVWCVDVETGDKTPLYKALEDPDFECPEGLF